jgi:predicted PurR-regulated permease PerM
VANLLVQFGLALAIFFFMISAALSLPTPARLGLDPNAAGIGRVAALTEDVRRYMTVLTGINFLVALGDTLFLMILGVDYAVLWGLLALFMGYIPSIGFIIALIPPVLMAYVQYGLSTAAIVLVGFVLINGGVQNFYQPKVMGDRLRISPVVVFIGLFVWGYLLGGIGAILAVPMTILVLTIMENFEVTRPLAVLMRYTGEEKKEERQEAAKQVKGVWGKVKGTFSSDRESEDRIDSHDQS